MNICVHTGGCEYKSMFVLVCILANIISDCASDTVVCVCRCVYMCVYGCEREEEEQRPSVDFYLFVHHYLDQISSPVSHLREETATATM